MRYLISSQWSMLERFEITDESGALAFEVRGHLGSRLTVHDASGQQVAEITKRMFSETHEVYVGGDLAAQVRHGGFFGDRYEISSAYGVFEARGRMAGWDFALTQGGMPVAQMNRQFSVREKFAVDIADNENAVFVLAIMMAVEAIHDERARRR
jgi:uncharacterized protein YxjI